MFRVDPPPTVDWYDIDFSAVVAARRQLMPQRPHAHTIGADLTDPHWLDEVPADRPAVIVADGLVAFLAEDDFVSLLNRLTSHFPSGELAFNGYTRFHVWALKHYRGTQSIAAVVPNPGFDDPHEPERWNPRLTLVKEILLTRAPEVAGLPLGIRLVTRCQRAAGGVRRFERAARWPRSVGGNPAVGKRGPDGVALACRGLGPVVLGVGDLAGDGYHRLLAADGDRSSA